MKMITPLAMPTTAVVGGRAIDDGVRPAPAAGQPEGSPAVERRHPHGVTPAELEARAARRRVLLIRVLQR